MLHSRHERTFSRRNLSGIGKDVRIGIHRHRDVGMPHASLHGLHRQSDAGAP